VTQYHEGDPTTEAISVFENCQETPYANAVRGPHGVFALLGDGSLAGREGDVVMRTSDDVITSIRRDGREIGTVAEANIVFAP
jgi:hypothetical protein